MSEHSSRSARHSFTGTGFYIALFLVATALAVAGYWSLLPRETAVTPVEDTPTPPPVVRPIVNAPEPEPEPAPEPAPSEEEPVDPVQAPVELIVPSTNAAPVAPRLIVPPLVGDTAAAFSVDYPVYNETLGDWRTHDGIDIAAPLGTQVLAACSGTVREIRDDDLMGMTVVLDHGDGYETIYANLQEHPTVEQADYVSAGQVIGSVGQTALAESAGAPHLHFAVTKDGEPSDPEAFLRS